MECNGSLECIAYLNVLKRLNESGNGASKSTKKDILTVNSNLRRNVLQALRRPNTRNED